MTSCASASPMTPRQGRCLSLSPRARLPSVPPPWADARVSNGRRRVGRWCWLTSRYRTHRRERVIRPGGSVLDVEMATFTPPVQRHSGWSCPPTLRLIPPIEKFDTMAPYDTIMRGHCDDSAPDLLTNGVSL